MKYHRAKPLKTALVSCVFALGAATTAHAAYVVIRADPAFGPEFPNLGWRATGALFIPDSCKAAIGLLSYVFNPLSVSLANIDPLCSSSRLQDVKLQFYNLQDPAVTVELLDIGLYGADRRPRDSSDDLVQELMDYSFSRGALVGFHSTLSVPKRATDLLAGGGSDCFSLELSSNSARLVAFGYANGVCGTTPMSQSSNAASVTWGGFIADSAYRVAPDPAVTPTVPEPTSLALTLAALAAAALAGRAGASSARPRSEG